MLGLFENMSALEKIYAITAGIAGALFVVRLALQFISGLDGDVGDGDLDLDDGDTDSSFRLLSLQGLTAFFLMFGLTGLALLRNKAVNEPLSLLAGLVAGLITVWIMGKLFSLMLALQSSGTLKIENAVGRQGTVYLRIPGEGTGKVRVTVQNRLKVFDAVSEGDVEIETGQPIKVVGTTGSNMLVVAEVG